MDKRAVLDRLIAAWRHHDIDAVVAEMTDDIVWHYHVGSKPARGKDAARKILGLLAKRQLNIGWKIFSHAESGNRLYVEGADVYDTPNGVSIKMPYMGILEFNGEKICAWRDYVDSGIVNKLEAGEQPADYLVELAARAAS